MVILNATIGFFLKVLSIYGPIFDLHNITTLKKDDFEMYILIISQFCVDHPTCHLIENTAQFLSMFSFLILLVFFLKFDKNFNSSFKALFTRQSSKS